MNKLIEKIVEQLQDLRDSNSNSAKGSWNRNDSLIFSHISHAFQQAIDIIHEEAKAYNESVNGDWISRSFVISVIKHFQAMQTWNESDKFTEILRKIEDEPTAYNDGWIPCSERLPEEGAAVRVWLSFTNPVTSFTKRAWWLDNHFEWDNGQIVKDTPIAWMLSVAPEPYQPKGE